jgi:hypothetical protein
VDSGAAKPAFDSKALKIPIELCVCSFSHLFRPFPNFLWASHAAKLVGRIPEYLQIEYFQGL